ncbi:MAG: hypothetical protein AB9897_02450 [Anaerolineaceae bacterium]
MNTIESISNSLIPLGAQPDEDRLVLIIAPHAGMPLMVELAARLALNGEVRVLDGGNRFNVYPVAQAVRRLTPRLEETLSHISLSRAFTCYQMLTLLEETPAHSIPTLVLDLLATFLDENVRLEESRRLLQLAITQLQRLSQSAPLVMSVKPPIALMADRMPLLNLLQQASTRTLHLEAQHKQAAVTLPLFS